MTGDARVASPQQLDLWLAAGQDAGSPRYNVPIALDFAARPDEAALRTALARLSGRHPALRSSFHLDGTGQLRRTVADELAPTLRVVRATTEPDLAERSAWAARVGLRPFALDAGGVARADLLLHPAGAVLVLTVHHVVADGWSVEVLVDDLLALYGEALAGGSTVDGAGEQDAEDTADPGALGYWLDLLADEVPVLEPIPDRIRGARPSRAAREEVVVEGAELAALRAYLSVARISMSSACLAAWSVVLHQWSGVHDGLLAMPFSARVDPATHRTVGLLSRVLPVRSVFDPATPWREHLAALHLQVLESFDNSAVDTGALRAAVAAQGHRFPFSRTVYTHFTEPPVRRVPPEVAVSPIDVDLGAAKYDVSVAAAEGADRLRLEVEYDTAVHRPASARAMLAQLHGLLLAAAADPDAGLDDLLHRAEAATGGAAATGTWGDTPAAVPPPQLVLEVAAAAPDRVAVVDGDRRLTYGELAGAASRLARWLLDTGTDATVGVLLPGGADAVVAFLGIALAGKAYVPMDPDGPAARLATIVADSGVRRILTSAELAGRAESLGAAPVTVAEAVAGEPGPLPALHPDMLLNVLYTSGSTGRPKGVMLPHRGVARLMRTGGHLHLAESDRVAQLSPLNFDGATYEIWGTLCHGARLVVLDKAVVLSPAELRDAVRRHGVTALIITTPVFDALVAGAPDVLQSLTLVSLGGDVASVPRVAAALAWSGPGVLVHTYGPTENSFTSLLAPVDELEEGDRAIPIGRCVAGTEAYVVRDGTLDLAPVGAPGELLLGGDGLAHGYLGDPVRTAERFVPDPFGPPGRRLYRTGDRVRRLPDGRLEFVGRTDDQVKVRSQRIELGEVRAALLADPAVRDAYVAAGRNARDEAEIAAYVVVALGTVLGHVRDRLGSALPAAAVPVRWARLDALPLNANGKVDRDRLPAATLLGEDAGPAPRPPSAAGVGAVRAAWREVLDDAPVRDDVNFFDAGGHSLLLARLQAALRRHAGVEVRVADLFRYPSIAAQAELLAPGAPAESTVAGPVDAREPIAVIGAACRFAGAADVRAFWRTLDRDSVAGAGSEVVELGDGRRGIARWGALEEPRAFDAELFGLTPDQARATDPQHGLLHECFWAAAEDAAVTLDRLRDRTAIYAGSAPAGPAASGGSLSEDLSAAFDAEPGFAATRYAYRHDLRGESVMVDTACSTSLVAVHLACASLRSGSSDYALAGGVSIMDPAGGYVSEPGMIYATDGVCRPFDEAATGTVGGDGAGAVLLRRLSDAVRDGDPIHAVILGSAVNNDGHARAGYAAPGMAGQVSVVRHALAAAGVAGGDVGFVETHGTGTRLGDAVEATALAEAVGERAVPLPISSVKAAIGHCNTAAGIAGLLKAVHAVRDHVLPGTVNSADPIEELGDRLRLLTSTEEWPDAGRPRVAGVSSFGIGGTNAHVVIQEYVETEPPGVR